MRSPIIWFGGKGHFASTVISLLPAHHTYVEVFAGGASVFFAKPPSPVEVLNDLDGALVEFYRVLRDRAMFEAFARRVSLTPYAKSEYLECRETWETQDNPVERAARWFVASRMAFAGKHISQKSGWSYSVTESSRGMAQTISRWLQTIDNLYEVHERLRQAQVECQDWRKILETYDRPDTCFYLDPPYVLSTRRAGKFSHELTDADHTELVARCLVLRGKVVLSGYMHPIYAPLEDAGWECRMFDVPCYAVGRMWESGMQSTGMTWAKNQRRIECIWRNPAASQSPTMDLFAGGEE